MRAHRGSTVKGKAALTLPKHFPLIIIEWGDHGSHDSWFASVDEADSRAKPSIIHSCGWLINETEEYYLISAGISINDHMFTNVQSILKATVSKTRVIG